MPLLCSLLCFFVDMVLEFFICIPSIVYVSKVESKLTDFYASLHLLVANLELGPYGEIISDQRSITDRQRPS